MPGPRRSVLVAEWKVYRLASDNSLPEIVIIDSDNGNSVGVIGTNYFNANYPNNDVTAVAWSPNGKYIATIDGTLQIWNAPGQS
jgi:WD40 repeat protein